MNQEQATKFIHKMYKDVWQHPNVENLSHYFSCAFVGRNGNVTIYYDDIKKLLINLSKQYREIIPEFHRIMANENQITVWFTQYGIEFDGKEHLRVETMLTYGIHNEKICEMWFVWDIETSVFYNEKTHSRKFSTDDEGLEKLKTYHLTKRELETLYYLIRHFNTKEISKILDISPRTVESHIQSIKNKLKITTQDQIVQFAVSHGYTRPIPELVELAIRSGVIKPLKF